MTQPRDSDVIRWNRAAVIAGVFIVAGLFAIAACLYCTFTQPGGPFFLIGALGGAVTLASGIGRARRSTQAGH